ncbi:hypothetical protein TSMEX_000512 [Taenia solium]|eukprot:TsM_000254300 transcript=TsM_000254300 gene=TsM_000254300
MSEAIIKSSAVETFCESLKNRFLQFWPNYQGIIRTIPQSVIANRSEAVDNQDVISTIESHLQTKFDNFFLFVGRLRPVKDPKYILQPFLELERNRSTRHPQLLYIGSIVSKIGFDHTSATLGGGL